MKKLWLDELRRLVLNLNKEFKRNEIQKDSPFGKIVSALIELVGIDRHPAIDPKPEAVKKLAEVACCSDIHLAFVCSTDEQAFQRVLSKLTTIIRYLESCSTEILAV
jgi:hypothetical protein